MINKNLTVLSKNINFILVCRTLYTGGIETLVVRLANFLVDIGYSVSVYCIAQGELINFLSSRINLISYSEFDSISDVVRRDAGIINSPKKVVILSFDPATASLAIQMEMAMPRSRYNIHITGVFHPRAYFMNGEPADRVFLNSLLVNAVGKNNIFFMNQECRESHVKKWQRNLSDSPIIPLPISYHEPLWNPPSNSSLRIVSVGRLVDFKAYNLGLVKIVRSCLDKGLDVSLDIFGYGSLEEQIRSSIESMGVAQNVRLMGKLDYKDFPAKVASYDLFVGMGTAAVEAAMVGVPTICALVDELSSCHGYLCDLPLGNVGEYIENKPLMEIETLINSFAISDVGARRLLSESGIKAAKLYGMPTFVESLMNMVESYSPSKNRLKKYLIGNFYHSMTEGFLARLFFGRGLKTWFIKFIR